MVLHVSCIVHSSTRFQAFVLIVGMEFCVYIPCGVGSGRRGCKLRAQRRGNCPSYSKICWHGPIVCHCAGVHRLFCGWRKEPNTRSSIVVWDHGRKHCALPRARVRPHDVPNVGSRNRWHISLQWKATPRRFKIPPLLLNAEFVEFVLRVDDVCGRALFRPREAQSSSSDRRPECSR